MSDEVPVTPINTGLAEKTRQRVEVEKARLRALMPSAANSIVESAPPVTPQQGPIHKSTGLAEKTRQRLEEEKEKLRSIMPSAKLEEDTPQPFSGDTKREEWLDFGKATVTSSESGSGDYCREPAELNWAPVTPQEIVSKYPKNTAVSDIKMILNAALQQPELAVALIGARGTSYLVKTDKAGQFYMAQPDNDPKNFTNPGLNTVACVHNTDGTLNDNPEDAAAAKAQMTPFYRKAMFESDAFAFYEDIEKEFGKLEEFSVTEEVKKTTVNEGKQKTIKATELNSLLYSVQKALRESEEPSLEKLANKLSEEIATTLISGLKNYNYDKYCQFANTFVKIMEG